MMYYMKNILIRILKKYCNVDVKDIQLQNQVLLTENATLEKNKNTLTEQIGIISQKAVALEEERDSLSQKAVALEEERDSLSQKAVALKEERDSLSQKAVALEEEKDNIVRELQEKRQILKSVDENNNLKVSDEQIQDQIESLSRQYQILKEQYDSLYKENMNYKARICAKDATIDILNKDIIELKNENFRLKKIVPIVARGTENDDYETENTSNSLTLDSLENKPKANNEEQKIIIGTGLMTMIAPIGSASSNSYIDDTKRTIDTVIDTDTGVEIKSKDFFAQPENLIFKVRTELQRSIYLRKPKFICKYCRQAVKISGRKIERGVASFFSHLRDSEECDYKTTTGKAKRDIEREKYARCNEGERHKFLKIKIANLLEKTPGVSEVKIENTVMGNHPILKWKRPDVWTRFRGEEIVFELQLSTTFVSVIAERDLFYRLNKKFIIWVFNFDEQENHVDLNNMMSKDIYYNNKLNIFIFDKDAQRESEKRGELILKCNWLKADGNWEYTNGNSSNDLGGIFISLSELTYDNTYKPYYFDAEQKYFEAHPEFRLKTLDVEEENKRILEELNTLWLQEQEELKVENKLELLSRAFELDDVVKSTQKYVIGRKNEKCGLITFDGEIRIAFEYESIISRRGWYEGKKDGMYDLFDKNNFTSLNTGIRRIEEFNPIGAKYVKEVNGELLWGIMTKTGTPLTTACYSHLAMWSPDKIIAIHNGLYCIVDFQGNEILSNYEYISELSSDNVATVKYDGRNGLIDSNCKSLKEERKNLNNDFVKFSQMGKWGIERIDGSTVVSCKYDEIGSYKDRLVGINDVSFSIIDEKMDIDCPVKVKYVYKNDRKMLIFKLGKREAFMNVRQQKKALRLGLQPQEMKELYLSFVNTERSLLYLSAIPIKKEKQQMEIEDRTIPLGTTCIGKLLDKKKNGVIIQTLEGETIFLHNSTLGKYTLEELENSKSITLKKIGYNQYFSKHIWEITSVLS